jgi:pyridinium-3,5-bisthiocarboxylic acid mononucleotide nickel chelatase
MTTLYFDAFSGVSGDMTLGALLHMGLPLEHLRQQLGLLGLDGYRLEMRPAEQQHITGVKLDVILEKEHDEHRPVTLIHTIIERSELPPRVKERAKKIFWTLAVAEGKIHNISPDAVHFHEVGAIDAIVDVVGACIGFEYFGIDEFYCSPLPVGGGFVRAAHGLMPLPAPATLELLANAGAPLVPSLTLSGGIEYPARAEMVTPTGAAIVAALCKWERPAFKLQKTGYGFGSKEFAWVNCLRLWLGERTAAPVPAHSHSHDQEHNHSHEHQQHDHSHEHHHHDHSHEHHQHGHSHEHNHSQEKRNVTDLPAVDNSEPQNRPVAPGEVVSIEANLDDMTPEALGFLLEKLLAAGALDVYFTPIQMKKNRPATLLSVLGHVGDEAKLANLILRESSTFGVRCSRLERYVAGREFRQVTTSAGTVQMKLKILGGEILDAVPEYDSVAALARQTGRPWREIYDEAKRAFFTTEITEV